MARQKLRVSVRHKTSVLLPFTSEQETIANDLEQRWEAGAVDRAWDALRQERNTKLHESDWTQMSDVPSEDKTAWATYRQSLRDLPANTPDPANPTWPTSPE